MFPGIAKCKSHLRNYKLHNQTSDYTFQLVCSWIVILFSSIFLIFQNDEGVYIYIYIYIYIIVLSPGFKTKLAIPYNSAPRDTCLTFHHLQNSMTGL